MPPRCEPTLHQRQTIFMMWLRKCGVEFHSVTRNAQWVSQELATKSHYDDIQLNFLEGAVWVLKNLTSLDFLLIFTSLHIPTWLLTSMNWMFIKQLRFFPHNSMTKQAAGKNLNYVWRFFGQTQRETNGKQLIFQGRETFITCVSALLLDVFFCQTLEKSSLHIICIFFVKVLLIISICQHWEFQWAATILIFLI